MTFKHTKDEKAKNHSSPDERAHGRGRALCGLRAGHDLGEAEELPVAGGRDHDSVAVQRVVAQLRVHVQEGKAAEHLELEPEN